MHHPGPRPRFPQGGMPRFPTPQSGPPGRPGWMNEPWRQRFPPPRADSNQVGQRFPPPRADTNQVGQRFPPPRVDTNQVGQRFPPPRVDTNQVRQRFPPPRVDTNQVRQRFPPPRVDTNQVRQRFPPPRADTNQAGQRFPHSRVDTNQVGQRFPPPRADSNQVGQRFPPPRPDINQVGQRFQPHRQDTNQSFQPRDGRFPGPQMRMNGPPTGPRFGGTPRPPGPSSFSSPPPGGHMARPYCAGPPGPRPGPPGFPRQPGQNNFQQRPKFKNIHGQPQPQGNKKAKVDKRDLPENNRYFCDSCDRGFKDEEKYTAHTDTHEQCPEPGCTYVAAGKLVQLHVRLQHRAGLAKKIWSLETPEDIQKWREERKKNFPTAENISRKTAVQAEKRARGEVIEEKYFGKMRNRGRGGFQGRGRGRGRGQLPGDRREGDQQKRKLPGETGPDSEGPGCTPQKQLKTDISDVPATQDSTADSLTVFFGSANSDEDSEAEGEVGQTVARPVTAAGALGSLMATYQDSSEEEEEGGGTRPGRGRDENQNTVTDAQTTEESRAVKKKEQGKKDQAPHQNRKHRNRKKNKRQNKGHPLPMVDKSLLEKLLAKEIRHERNQILQCVHYIVKHRFFDKSTAKSTTTAT